MVAAFWRERAGGLDLAVRVTPRGGRDAIDGVAQLADGRSVLKVRVRVVPEDGAANKAVEKLIAQVCDVPARDVRICAGASARLKQVAVDGDKSALIARLQAL